MFKKLISQLSLVIIAWGLPAGSALGQLVQKDVLTVQTAQPSVEDWPISIPAGGWVAAWEEAVIASEIGDLKIVELKAKVGDKVRRGQVLARLEQDLIRAEIRESEAAVQAALADYSLAKTKGDRARKLLPAGAATRQQYEEDIYVEQSAAARLAMAEAALERLKLRLGKTNIAAVDDGYISMKKASLGQVAPIGGELFRLVRQNRAEWLAEIAVSRAGQVEPGQRAIIKCPGGAAEEGQVLFVEPLVKKESARAVIHVALQEGSALKIGSYAGGGIMVGRSPALAVPETAVTARDGFSYVFVVRPDSRASRIKVESGRRHEGRVEVSGLEKNALVVVDGGAFLADGDQVLVLNDEEPL
ncbi:MAG: efflux RND transporter periplasmic adaptor subunit [Candidatus Adiutrix sp.]|jgi:RND family efflux transporter MFP subunit|nr:efflux RND transporter periplasmic adaptor subunit [Candidatus Adiutrix sp.]